MSKRSRTAPWRVEYRDGDGWRIKSFELSARMARRSRRDGERGGKECRIIPNPHYQPPDTDGPINSPGNVAADPNSPKDGERQ